MNSPFLKPEDIRSISFSPQQSVSSVSNTHSAWKSLCAKISENTFVKACFNSVVTALHHRSELKVEYKRDPSGEPYWYVYDPQREKSFIFASDEAVLAWLEKRHHAARSHEIVETTSILRRR